MKLDKQKYQQMLEQKSPNSPLWKDCLKAFLFGGAICTVGEGVSNFWQSRGLETADAAAATAITMVFLGALLTCLFIGYVAGAKTVTDEVELSGVFKRKRMYEVMVRYIAPICLLAILVTFGVLPLLQ